MNIKRAKHNLRRVEISCFADIGTGETTVQARLGVYDVETCAVGFSRSVGNQQREE